MVAAREARAKGTALTWPNSHLGEFEAAYFELALIAANPLVQAAQELWAVTADYAYSGSADNEDDDRCERARTSFIEEARNEFRLPNLFEEQPAPSADTSN